MATNNINRFRKEDYSESPSWWDRAIYNLNLLIDYIYSITQTVANQTLSIAALTPIQTYTLTQTSASNSTTTPTANTFNFPNKLKTIPNQVLLRATNSTNPVFTSVVWASWHTVNGIIYIDAITGLANSIQYNFTVSYY